MEVNKYAKHPIVCRSCGFIINQEGYTEVDHKAYHKKCVKESK